MPATRPTHILAAALASAFLAGAHAGELAVSFIHPEQFTDARLSPASGADPIVLRTLEQHLQSLAQRCLGPGQTLEIAILDVDLAGRRSWQSRSGAYGYRVMGEIDWPRIALVWRLDRGAGDVSLKQERVSDMDYLLNSAYVRGDTQPLPYERTMLTNWFQQRFCS